MMANYAIDPKILEPYVPYKTELDLWNGTCYVSLIGFMFLNTTVKGIRFPFHVNFEEVNLRFYVRHKDNGEWKRGVVFHKELVPRFALSFIANTLYGEHYESLPMAHQWDIKKDSLSVEYKWKKAGQWHSMEINTTSAQSDIEAGSEEEFITEHYWGYTKIKDQVTSEYGVEHPRWKIYDAMDYAIDVNFEANYGKAFAFLQSEKPKSVFLAEGSEVEIKAGRKI
jgi:uncharacterized protein YqjF (DUF2071 family)